MDDSILSDDRNDQCSQKTLSKHSQKSKNQDLNDQIKRLKVKLEKVTYEKDKMTFFMEENKDLRIRLTNLECGKSISQNNLLNFPLNNNSQCSSH